MRRGTATDTVDTERMRRMKDSEPGRAGSQTPDGLMRDGAEQGDGEKTVDYQLYDHPMKPAFACHLLHVAGGCPVGLTNGAILDKIE